MRLGLLWQKSQFNYTMVKIDVKVIGSTNWSLPPIATNIEEIFIAETSLVPWLFIVLYEIICFSSKDNILLIQ